mgnify:CR=1 FL=1
MAALLKSRGADRARADAHLVAVSAGVFAHAARHGRCAAGRELRPITDFGTGHDGSVATCVREQSVEPDAIQDKGQYRVCAVAANLSCGVFLRLPAGSDRPRSGGGGRHVSVCRVVCARASSQPRLDNGIRAGGQRRHGHAGYQRRHAIRQGR